MHTFELICEISREAYCYLEQNLPSLSSKKEFVKRTNYYSKKGIEQIELIAHIEYDKKNHQKKIIWQSYYLVLRCNPSIIMGDSKVFLLDMDKYTADEIIKGFFKRIYEINEFRYIRLHKFKISDFKIRRVDIAKDILVKNPAIIVWLCNMSFPYKHCQMTRNLFHKDRDILYYESCYFSNKSRTVNFYNKHAEIINNRKETDADEQEEIKKLVRFEIQIKKKVFPIFLISIVLKDP